MVYFRRLFRRFRLRRCELSAVVQRRLDLAAEDDGKDDQQHRAFPARDDMIRRDGGEQQHRRKNGQRPVAAQQHLIHHERTDDGRKAGNNEQIEYVRADDVADRDLVRAPERRRDADRKLRHGCTEGNDGQTDEQGRDAHFTCECARTLDEFVRAPHKKHETDDKHNK